MDSISNKYDCKMKLKIDNSAFKYHPYYKVCKTESKYTGDVSIYDLGCKIIDNKEIFNKFFSFSDYDSYLNNVDEISKLFGGRNLEYGGGKNGQVIMLRLKRDVINKNIEMIESLYQQLLPSVEENIYGSKIKVVDINAYINMINNLKVGHSSWLWHFDNQPNEIMKMMIYLSDVDEQSAPFEIIVDENDNPIRLISNRFSAKDFENTDTPQYFNHQYNGNRFGEQDILELKKNGYRQKKIYGKKGTIILFSNDIIHRATYPKTNPRLVLNTVLSPTLKDQRFTGQLHKTNYKWFEE